MCLILSFYGLANIHIVVNLHYEKLAVILSWNNCARNGKKEKPESEEVLGLFVSFLHLFTFSYSLLYFGNELYWSVIQAKLEEVLEF